MESDKAQFQRETGMVSKRHSALELFSIDIIVTYDRILAVPKSVQ
jgi:hypothetical protein